jgi:spermidine/putrescine transport system ATP-binding protein
MDAGRIEQIGTPADVYEDPATVFVADFLGVSNLTAAEAVSGTDQDALIRIGEFTLRASSGDIAARGPVKIVARPERVELLPFDAGERENSLPGLVERTVYVGANVQVIVRLATGQVMQAQITNTGSAGDYHQGAAVLIHIPPEALRVLAARGRDGAEPSEEAPSAEAVAAG